MRDDICTIPVSEVFEVNDGCPICRMYNTVQEHIVDYIMGAAMMEPDVRIATNKAGFCEKHYLRMLNHRGRLSLALMLDTHTAEINSSCFSGGLFSTPKSKGEKARSITDSCFICDKIEWGMSRMLDTIYNCYETDRDFREMFDSQKMFCLPHYERLINGVDRKKMRSYSGEFTQNLSRITREYSESLHSDLKKYCSMYDYRNNTRDADWGTSRDSVERAVSFLTGTVIE